MSHDAALLEQLPPEKLLDTSNYRVIRPAIEMMEAVETVEQYLTHERANRNRAEIIRRLTDRLDAIQKEVGEQSPVTESKSERVLLPRNSRSSETETVTNRGPKAVAVWMPTKDLLSLVHNAGKRSPADSSTPPTWDEL
ncbi:hypothetical protein EFA46_015770 (plasmid) [Halarchaeum sp. CBA1220]|uniref:hypothetical protein n=1 Tax=Halarchaeum sp. CBA1220 TaxID=1853682 RepID=UPI0011CE8DFD|nr:hypothetical protein [Halarchaeum sp. CBA1220]QLC35711.1 hypothetical protein EFA46_015770 [Halarchaeum sp. CBA1220]